MSRRRTAVYAAFAANGVPALNVWSYSRAALEVLVADRIANGEALPGEHVVRCTVPFYNKQLTDRGWSWARLPEVAS